MGPVPLLRDFATARRLVRNIVNSRRNRRAVAQQLPAHPDPAPGTIKIAVYFADTKVNLYQVRQWYAPLAELASTWPVAVIARAPSTVLALWDEAPVPALYLRSVADLEQFVQSQDIRIVFYVNQNAKNFQMFRYGRMWHVFINHGESDKMYMTTNQFKAYDYSFVAGDAAIDRLSHKLWDFDLKRRAIPIGRPQADHYSGSLPYTPDDRTVVLYAPTWEGDRPSAHYGSIATHGEALVNALLATGRHRVIYRPHPRSGVVDPEYGAAHRRIITAIEAANAADHTAQHVYDDRPELGWQLVAADVAVVDISAMVYDRLAAGKPLMITRPVDEEASIDANGYLSDCEWLTVDAAPRIVAEVDRVRADEAAITRLRMWVQHYFGDTTPGVATEKFHAAVEGLMREWDRWHAHEVGSARSDVDDDDEETDEEEV